MTGRLSDGSRRATAHGRRGERQPHDTGPRPLAHAVDLGGYRKDGLPAPPPGTYWPPELEEVLNEERVSIHDLDPDEVLRPFVPEAHRVDQSKDQRLKHLAEHLAQAFSAHNAAVRLMEMGPDWDFFAVYYRTMDEISHDFLHYHPQSMEGFTEEDFDLYHRVIDQTYCLHDAMLQRLIQIAGPDTAVVLVSDHGYHRPVATIRSWEREDRPARARLNLSEGGRQQLLEQTAA